MTTTNKIKIFVIFSLLWCGLSWRTAHAAEFRSLALDHYSLPQTSEGAYQTFIGANIDVSVTSATDMKGKNASVDSNQAGFQLESGEIYTATLTMPIKPGSYEINIQGEGIVLAKVILRDLPVVVDPTGHPAYGGRVTLQFKDPNGLWQIWDSPSRKQNNPIHLGYTGQYGFYVDKGDYRLLIESSGAEAYYTDPIEVSSLTVLSQGATLSYAKQTPDVQQDSTVVTLVNLIIDRIAELQKDLKISELTRNAILPFSWLVFLITLLGFLVSILAQFGLSLSLLPSLPMLLMHGGLNIFGGKKNLIQWGIVSELQSGFAIPLATIMLFHEDDHRLLSITVSSMDGTYGFKAKEGKFSVFVSKRNYQFPADAAGLYRGQPFMYASENPVMTNLVMHRIKPFEEERASVLAVGSKMVGLVKEVVLIIGLLMSLWGAVILPGVPTVTLVIIYFFLIMARIRNHRRVSEAKMIERGA